MNMESLDRIGFRITPQLLKMKPYRRLLPSFLFLLVSCSAFNLDESSILLEDDAKQAISSVTPPSEVHPILTQTERRLSTSQILNNDELSLRPSTGGPSEPSETRRDKHYSLRQIPGGPSNNSTSIPIQTISLSRNLPVSDEITIKPSAENPSTKPPFLRQPSTKQLNIDQPSTEDSSTKQPSYQFTLGNNQPSAKQPSATHEGISDIPVRSFESITSLLSRAPASISMSPSEIVPRNLLSSAPSSFVSTPQSFPPSRTPRIPSVAPSYVVTEENESPTLALSRSPSNNVSHSFVPGGSEISSDQPSGSITNVAIGKNASQSSTYCCSSGRPSCCPQGDPSLAVDGNTSGYFGNGSTTRTNKDLNPWWKVDLGNPYVIDSIKVYKRSGTNFAQRLRGFVLEVYMEGNIVMTYQHAKNKMVEDVTIIEMPSIVIGDEVKVSLQRFTSLFLAEVEVFSSSGTLDYPSDSPSLSASSTPSMKPTKTVSPSNVPTESPSTFPISMPSVSPTKEPTFSPSEVPSEEPTSSPSQQPTLEPSYSPSTNPSKRPTKTPSHSPTLIPSTLPTFQPTSSPTHTPSREPSNSPSYMPTLAPSTLPTFQPTPSPTRNPTRKPSISPSNLPTRAPSKAPTLIPTTVPTELPTSPPTTSPTLTPSTSAFPSNNPSEEVPNVVMIITDEHSFRTLGSYRRYYRKRLNQPMQASMWGDENFVYTPNLDRLADEGALFSNFYTVTPLCTPSRASFMSGLMPAFTGESDLNHGRMDDDVTTFAQILQEQKDFFTGYIGKFHLNGEATPGWFDSRRTFGFTNRRYQYNRGHWKYFTTNEDGKVQEFTEEDANGLFEDTEDKHFATDFLFDRGIDQMTKAIDRDEKFAIVLSIPDPHGPNQVRKPYDTMYVDNKFKIPESGKAALRRDPATPGWNTLDHEDIDAADAEAFLEKFENGHFYQNYMQQYFGMVKCIDENVGKLLGFLEEKGVDENTIVIFTSDHGDMLFEHGKMNKGRPYETSAGIPFLVRWPGKITPKVIETPYSSVDLTPTILSLVGINDVGTFHGVDASIDLLSSENMITDSEKIIFTFDGDSKSAWAASISNGYKLVVSKSDKPWFYDLRVDPDEMINFFDKPEYRAIVERHQIALFNAMKEYKIPLGVNNVSFFWDTPTCFDSLDVIRMNNGSTFLCENIGFTAASARCNRDRISRQCPIACSSCCQDSPGKLWINRTLKGCSELSHKCGLSQVQSFCPASCNMC